MTVHNAIRISALGLVLAATATGQVVDTDGVPDPSHPALYAWYDAATGVNGSGTPADGASVTRWDDRSAAGHDLANISGDPGERPTFRTAVAHGHPAVAFDGSDYLWSNQWGQWGTLDVPKTLFVAARVTVADGGYLFDGTAAAKRNALFAGQSSHPGQWVVYTGNDPVTGGPPVDAGVFQVHTVVFDQGANEHWLNAESVASGSSALAPLGGLTLGARYNLIKRLTGGIAELLVYEGVLAPTDRQAVEAYLLGKYPITEPPKPPPLVDVFTSGDGLYPTYRIPAILTTRHGTLLAFAEGRASASDHAENDIVMRRSTDSGTTWDPVVVLHDDGGNSLNNPCVVQVRDGPAAGRILVMYQRYPQGCHESCVVPGYSGPNICRSFLMTSDDDGLTWSAPVEVTDQVKPPAADSIAGGPGVGLQKRRPPHAGRIVMPFNHGLPGSNWKVYAVYSDDGGTSWAWGQVADDSASPGMGNEVQMVELLDGRLMLNSRSAGGTKHRKIAYSDDGGETWSPLQDELQLVEPQVMASILRLTDPLDGFDQGRLLYAGPLSQTSRVNGHVHLSADGGTTWGPSRQVYAGGYAYSVLTVLVDSRIGVLFERDGTDHISLARVSLEWLTEGADCLATCAWTDEGHALPGTNGSPHLEGWSTLLAGHPVRLTLTAARPQARAILVVGFEPLFAPFLSGVLVPDPQPPGFLLPLVTDDDRLTAITGRWPDGVPSGLTVFFQEWIADPQGPDGFAASNAVSARAP